jgi:hypothetical protein
MTKHKKIILFIAIVVALVALTAGTVYTINLIHNSKKTTTVSIPVKSQADTLNAKAAELIKNNNLAGAKTLLEQAQEKYKSINDKMGEADTAGQLSIVSGLLKAPKNSSTTVIKL